MADQDSNDSTLSALAKAAGQPVLEMASDAAKGAARLGKAVFGLAPAPGEDNEAYAKQYNTD